MQIANSDTDNWAIGNWCQRPFSLSVPGASPMHKPKCEIGFAIFFSFHPPSRKICVILSEDASRKARHRWKPWN